MNANLLNLIIIFRLFALTKGSLRHGSSIQLSKTYQIEQAFWSEINHWSVPLPSNQLFYTNGVTVKFNEIQTNKEGLYFISTNIIINNAAMGTIFSIMATVDQFNELDTVKGLRASKMVQTNSDITLSLSGFVYTRFDSSVRVFVKSNDINLFEISQLSTLSMHYYGNHGITNGFLAKMVDDAHSVTDMKWTTVGETALFNSGEGFTFDGSYIAPKDGIYIILCNFIVTKSSETMVEIYTSVNNLGITKIFSKYIAPGVETLNINTVLNLQKGSILKFDIRPFNVSISNQSTMSIINVGESTSSLFDLSNILIERNLELIMLSNTKKSILVDLYNHPADIILETKNNKLQMLSVEKLEGLMCNSGSYYFTQAQLLYEVQSDTSLISTLSLTVGSHTMSVIDTTEGINDIHHGSLTLSGTFKCDATKMVELTFKVSNLKNSSVFILTGSSFSFLELRLDNPISLLLMSPENQLDFRVNDMQEVKMKMINGDLVDFYKDGKFLVPVTGVYFMSMNAVIDTTGSNPVSLTILINGKYDENSGLFSTDSSNLKTITLNIASNILLYKDDVITANVKSTVTDYNIWHLSDSSGFFILYLGSMLNTPGMRSSLSSNIALIGTELDLESGSMSTAKTKNDFQNGRWLDSSGSNYNVIPFPGIYIVTCSIKLRSMVTGSAKYTLNVIEFSNQNKLSGYSSTEISASASVTLNAAGVYSLSPSNKLICRLSVEIDNTLSTVVESATFSAILLSYQDKGNGFNVALDSPNGFSNSLSWQTVTGFSDNRFPGFKTPESIFSLNSGQYSPSEESLLAVFTTMYVDQSNPTNIYEGAMQDSATTVTDKYGLYSRQFGSKFLSFSGLLNTITGNNLQLVVREKNNSDTFYQLTTGSGWSAYTVPETSSYLPIALINNNNMQVEPYIVREMTTPTSISSLFPKLPGTYIIFATIQKTTTSNTLSSSIKVNNIIQFQLHSASIGVLPYGGLFYCNNQCLTEGIYISTSDTMHSLALFKVGKHDTDGFSMAILSNIKLSGVIGNYDMNDFAVVTGENYGQSKFLIPTKTSFYLFQLNLNFNGAGVYQIKLVNQSSELILSEINTSTNVNNLIYTGVIQLEKGQLYHLQLHYQTTSNAEIVKESSIGVSKYLHNGNIERGFISIMESNFNLNITKYELKYISSWHEMFNNINGHRSGSPSFYVPYPGTYLVAANMIIESDISSMVTLDIVYEDKINLPGLFVKKKMNRGEVNTFNILAPIHLQKYRFVGIALSADISGTINVLKGSSFSVTALELDNKCCTVNSEELSDIIINPIQPSNNYTAAVTSNRDIKCSAKYAYRVDFHWYQDNKMIWSDFGKLESALKLSNIQKNQDGSYHCEIKRGSTQVSSDKMKLHVIDLIPEVTPTQPELNIDENLKEKVLLQTFTAFAFISDTIQQYATIEASIVNDKSSNMFSLELSSKENGIYKFVLSAVKTFDYENQKLYHIDLTFLNVNTTLLKRANYQRNVTVTLNINNVNEPPSIVNPPKEFNISEDAAIGQECVKVTATDDGPFHFSILNGSSSKYFEINETSGLITLKAELDRENINVHIIYVKVYDGEFSKYTEIKINVTDVNDNKPRFNKQKYEARILETVPIESAILQLDAADDDIGINSNLTFKITYSNYSNNIFKITNKGMLVTLQSFQSLELYAIRLIVSVTDGGGLTSEQSCIVNIRIIDVNDNTPIFELDEYTINVREGTTGPLLHVRATDKDVMAGNRIVSYYMTNEDIQNKIFVDSKSGLITTNITFDYENKTMYQFEVFASDNNNIGKTNVVINILDENDNTPIFQSSNKVLISENTPINSVVFEVFATDLDATSNGKLKYFMTSQTPVGAFAIDFITGYLSLIRPLDYEQIKSYAISLIVADTGLPIVLYSEQILTVDVENVNEHFPKFDKTVYNFEIDENSILGGSIGCITANDLDRDDLTYMINTIYISTMSSFFGLNTKTGCITSKISFNREERDIYEFAVDVKDNASIPLTDYTKVIIQILDINDNSPVFTQSQYSMSLSESTNIGHIVFKVSATDLDSGINSWINYSITDGNDDKSFLLDTEGDLILAKELDVEHKSFYDIRIIANDGGNPTMSSSTSIAISISDKNDNQPYFTKERYETSVKESLPSGSLVISVSAIDEDINSIVTYTMTVNSNVSDNYFKINNVTGKIYTNHNLDYELYQSYWLTVTATDNGTPKLRGISVVLILVEDMNDNIPVFDQFYQNISIALETVPGFIITTVKASDLDSRSNGLLKYTFTTPNSFFKLNADTGHITLKQTLTKFDPTFFMLQIQASDQGNPQLKSDVIMKVDVNIIQKIDNQPIFEKQEYTITIPEDKKPGYILSITAKTALTSKIIYSILPSPAILPFVISNTGDLNLSSALDYEKTSFYTFYVKAHVQDYTQDFSVIPLSIAISNINDNRPYFPQQKYEYTISEHAPIGLQIGKVIALDADTDDIILVFWNETQISNKFSLDATTGLISLASSLDYEEKSLYEFYIKANDQRNPVLESTTLAEVIVRIQNVNDNQPAFDKTEYVVTVKENVVVGSTILKLNVNDRDNTNQNIQLELINNGQAPFFLTQTGYLVISQALDRETLDSYKFSVQASDVYNSIQLKSTANIIIIIEDVNDNAPMFSPLTYYCTVSELALPGTLLQRVAAADSDEGLSSKIQYHVSNYQNLFRIDGNSGMVTLKTQLDFEIQNEYYISIYAEDQGAPILRSQQFAILHVKVLDENDHSPMFLQNIYNVTVKETQQYITTVSAIDEDIGLNGKIQYTLHSNYDSKFFILNGNTGEIRRNEEALIETTFSLSVLASDGGLPPRSSWTLVNIQILEVNNDPPVFETILRTVDIQENIANGSFVTKVTATDKDETSTLRMKYQIIFGNRNGKFAIDNDGVITTNDLIDRESTSIYSLTIQANDNGNPPMVSVTNALVVIRITDENDNAPKFTNPNYNISILESSQINSVIFQVTAMDIDFGSNADIEYNLVSTSKISLFTINKQSGQITLQKTLNFAEKQLHRLVIVAKDQGEFNQHSSIAELDINIINVNDRPFFSPSEYSITLAENSPIGFSVLTLQAFDLGDTIQTDHLRFIILSGNQGNHFTLEQNTLKVNKLLDYETIKSYAISIQVFDDQQPPLQAEKAATVNILLTNVNDNQPYFDRDTYFVYIKEELAFNTDVVQVRAIDNDPDAVLTYFLIYSKSSDYFNIDQSNGKITIKKRIDYESLDHKQLSFIVKVLDTKLPYMFTNAHVLVTVNDVNDHPPLFEKEIYETTISESNNIGSIAVQLTATDLDSGQNGKIRYYMSGQKPNDYFMIVDDLVILKKSLFDLEPKYIEFTVQAADYGFNPLQAASTANVSIKIEESSLVLFEFSQKYYNISIIENVLPGKEIVTPQLISTRKSKDIMYRLEHVTSEKLNINITTGIVRLKQSLDYSITRQVVALLIAKDSSMNTASTTVYLNVIDTNNHKPRFEQSSYNTTILTSTQIGSSLLNVKATDNDVIVGNIVNYRLITENTPFVISRDGEVQLNKALSTLLYINTSYILHVLAYDNGAPSLVSENTAIINIRVTTLAEITPTFNKPLFNIYIPENLPIGSKVFQYEENIKPLDSDVVVKCYTEIDDVTVKSIQDSLVTVLQFDKERQSLHTVLLTCRNDLYHELSSNAILHINILDVNDNSPQVINNTYDVRMSEHAQIGSCVLNIYVTDIDTGNNSLLNFRITNGNIDNKFVINANGQLSLSNLLDYETMQKYTLSIDISDSHISPQKTRVEVTVQIVDENEFNPMFESSNYIIEISEYQLIARDILSVVATDKDDFGLIVYSIEPNETFSINTYTGAIQLIKTVDFEIKQAYIITLIAKDNSNEPRFGFSRLSIFIQDENDNFPQPEKIRYSISVSESTRVGATLLRIPVTDADRGSNALLQYEMQGENIATISSNGVIMLTNTLDYETRKNYNMSVVISDSGTPSKTTTVNVQLNVINENEYSPTFAKDIFQATIYESANVLTILTQIIATDMDDFDRITYAFGDVIEIDHTFKIDTLTGKIMLARKLDFEVKTSYLIPIKASDNATNSLVGNTMLHVSVLDENDNAPVILNTDFTVVVSEFATVGNIIFLIKATDADKGNNSLLRYELANYNDMFKVNGYGEIILKETLDFELLSIFNLTIIISDSGDKPNSILTNVIVQVKNENEYSPVFSQNEYITSISESAAIGDVVIQVSALDPDSFGNMTYSISSFNDTFSIDENGKVFLNYSIDYEKRKSYDLIIIAWKGTNETNTKRGYATLFIDIIDENDNLPVPSQLMYGAKISESTSVGNTVLFIQATDGDRNAILNYSIEAGNEMNSFDVTSNGMIFVKSKLDYETRKTFNLSILISDSNKNPNVAKINAIIGITDENEHTPIFSSSLYSSAVSESIPVDYVVLQVIATDVDISDAITYALTGPSSIYFNINQNTGAIKSKVLFDFEKKTEYIFIVTSTDNGTNLRTSYSTIIVNILDENDNIPSFKNMPQGLTLNGPISNNTAVYPIEVFDADSVSKSLTVSLISQKDKFAQTVDLFMVITTSNKSASLVTKNVLTENQNYSFVLSVSDSEGFTSTRTIYLDIKVPESEVRLPGFVQEVAETSIQLSFDISKYFDDWKDRNQYIILAQEVHSENKAFSTQTQLPPVSWKEVNEDEEKSMRRYYAIDYDYVTQSGRRKREVKSFSLADGTMTFIVGNEKGCAETSAKTCNGPLKPNQIYRFQFMASGPNIPIASSKFSQTFATVGTTSKQTAISPDKNNIWTWILALCIVGLLFLLTIPVIAYLINDRQKKSNYLLKQRKVNSLDAFELNSRRITLPGQNHGSIFHNHTIVKDHEFQHINVGYHSRKPSKLNPIFSGSTENDTSNFTSIQTTSKKRASLRISSSKPYTRLNEGSESKDVKEQHSAFKYHKFTDNESDLTNVSYFEGSIRSSFHSTTTERMKDVEDVNLTMHSFDEVEETREEDYKKNKQENNVAVNEERESSIVKSKVIEIEEMLKPKLNRTSVVVTNAHVQYHPADSATLHSTHMNHNYEDIPMTKLDDLNDKAKVRKVVNRWREYSSIAAQRRKSIDELEDRRKVESMDDSKFKKELDAIFSAKRDSELDRLDAMKPDYSDDDEENVSKSKVSVSISGSGYTQF